MPLTRSLGQDEVEQMAYQRNQARLAYNVLAPLAKGRQVDETFGVYRSPAPKP